VAKLTGSKRLIAGNTRLIAFLIVFATPMPLLLDSASVRKGFVSDARERLSVEVRAAGRNVSATNSGWKPDTISIPLIDAQFSLSRYVSIRHKAASGSDILVVIRHPS